ncbi:hypothetical protein [Streptomyces sp. NPDC057429]|uniref:hypothetical protein n=1 Tax=Streptomyces sp. NPDC057429 TaxID=3346130 RepID=UPI0036AB857F
MPADQTPITGPIPVTVRTTPAAVILDLAALRDLIVADVIEALLDPEDTDLWDRLHELADTERQPVEGRLLTEELVEDIAEHCSSRILLPVTRARDLADRLAQAVGRFVMPRQQDWRAA